MSATSSAAATLPRTDALLAIDALPVWGAAGVEAGSAADTLAEPTAPDTPEPDKTTVCSRRGSSEAAATARPRRPSGVVAVALGVLAGVLLAGPFVDWRSAIPGGGSRAAGPQIASAPAPTLAAVEPARVVEAPETIEAARAPDVAAAQHATVEIEPVTTVEAAVDDAQPIVAAFEESASAAYLAAMPVAERLPARGGDAAPISAPPVVRPRVVVHYNAGRRTAVAIAERLEGRGAGRIELRRVNFVIRRSELRVFREAEAALAASLADAMSPNAPPPVRDFGHFRPPPSPGLIEVWTP